MTSLVAEHKIAVVYATYSASGASSQPVVEQLKEYRRCGCEIILVDTSPVLTAKRRADWEELCTHWEMRENVGYDFGSFKSGFATAARLMPEAHGVLLANDSVFGPFYPLDQLLKALSQEKDLPFVAGITDSNEVHYHLQSYWLYFNQASLSVISRFFEQMPAATNRIEAVLGGELALSKYMISNGVELRPSCSIEMLTERFVKFAPWSLVEFAFRLLINRPKYNRFDRLCVKHILGITQGKIKFNPMLALGRQLLAERLNPFVKKQLLRDNPYADPFIPSDLPIERLTNADVKRILLTRHQASIEDTFR